MTMTPNLAAFSISSLIIPMILSLDMVSPFKLTILHTNDVHARFEEYTSRDGRCQPGSTECFGGLARRATLVKAFRKQNKNVILLDAGDQYQGTPWFYYYKGRAASHFMNEIGYDAMSPGNHEFDNGVEGLIPFLKNVTFPVVCANIRLDEEPTLQPFITRSVTLIINGHSIGVIGYITQDTPVISNSGRVIFEDEVESIQAEVDRLRAAGVTKIIAVGHSGFAVDKNIAQSVRGVDVVIGGHTNTFTYTGTPPSTEKPVGPYPLMVTQDGGEKVLVLEAYAFGKYLGYLDLTFDNRGRVFNWTGNPILLDKSVEQDEETLAKLKVWGIEVQALYSKVVGATKVHLDGKFESCRLQECNLGNLLTDALVDHYQTGKNFSPIAIAVFNGGGIRSSIEEGNITYEDVLQVMPFRNEIDVIEILGSGLIEILEYSVVNYSREIRSGKFLQVSGMKVTYDLTKENYSRVKKVEVRCSNCSDRRFVPIQNDTVYRLAICSYLTKGGDGYSIIPSLIKRNYNLGEIDSDIFLGYLKRHSPVSAQIEGRIEFASGDRRTDKPMVRVNTRRMDSVASDGRTAAGRGSLLAGLVCLGLVSILIGIGV